jgi:uncharacterized protein involved in response to NO
VVQAHFQGAAEIGLRLGIGATQLLVMLIRGSIIPSFTRNWLARENPGRLPASHGNFGTASMIAAGAVFVL